MSKKPFTVLFPEDCTELTGIRRCDWKSQVNDLVVNVPFTPGDVPKMQHCTVFFHWPSEFGFLSLQPKVASELHKSGDAARVAAVEFYKKSGNPLRGQLVADTWFAYRFAGAGPHDAGKDGAKAVAVTINIDTSHDLFREQVRTRPGQSMTVGIDIDIGGAKFNSTTVELQYDKVALQVTIPARKLEPYDGVVAIDFGNTNSTLVACDDRDGVTCIPCEYTTIASGQSLHSESDHDPVPTVLEFVAYNEPSEQGKASTFRINYGMEALATTQPARLITGAKRMLADMPDSKSSPRTLRVLVGDGPVPVPIPAHDPAEIFISHMFAAFLHFVRKEPKRVAITCPSTFSETEANRVRIATVNGLRRALRQRPLLPPEKQIAETAAANTVKPCLDESTAAAFWFIQQEVLERRGRGAIEFQYLYPKGMNVLIYDCGGGTTDISLVKVGYAPSTTRLKIDVLGRRGHRTFGGDFITLQYAKYLKYQIYARSKGEPDDDEFAQFIAESTRVTKQPLLASVNEVLPTLFDTSAPRVGAVADARTRAWWLWNLAERLKCIGFEADETNESHKTSDYRSDEFDNFFLRIEPAVPQGDEKKRLSSKIGRTGFAVEKEHIRTMLAPVLDETIRYANELIKGRLPKDEEIHRVYLVGNASRFPIISERMLDAEHGLSVRFLSEKLVRGGPSRTDGACPSISYADLKNCVAKGAAVAIALQTQQKAIADWDEDVMKKLPYSIEYQDPTRAYPRVLFKCGTHMKRSTEAEETIQIHADAKGRVLTDRIRLSRRWPGAGDKELEEFIVFRFKDALVEGRYKVSYDGEGGFDAICLENKHKGLTAKGEPIIFPPSVPPSQSGEF
jgi:hypothetical protein